MTAIKSKHKYLLIDIRYGRELRNALFYSNFNRIDLLIKKGVVKKLQKN